MAAPPTSSSSALQEAIELNLSPSSSSSLNFLDMLQPRLEVLMILPNIAFEKSAFKMILYLALVSLLASVTSATYPALNHRHVNAAHDAHLRLLGRGR